VVSSAAAACGDAPVDEEALDEITRVSEWSLRAVARTTVVPVAPRPDPAWTASAVAVAEVVVGLDGGVQQFRILEAPRDEIAASVAQAVRQWKFDRLRSSGRWRRYRGKLTFYFHANGDVTSPETSLELFRKAVRGERP
jgi:hypothetical protein